MFVKGANLTRYIWNHSKWILFYHLTLSTSIYLIDRFYENIKLNLPIGVLSTIGIALSFFLGFMIRSTYDRWWEARIIWGGIVNYSRSFGRQIITLTDANQEIKKEMILRHISWLKALTKHLRQQQIHQEDLKLPKNQDWEKIHNKANYPTQLINIQANEIGALYKNDETTNFNWIQIDNTLTEFYNLQGKCERIKNTPFPKEFSYLSRFFVITFTSIIPLHMIDHFGLGVIPITVFEGFLFYILELLPTFYMNPFNNKPQDISMDALTRTIEIDLLQMLDENNTPPKIEPKDGVLM